MNNEEMSELFSKFSKVVNEGNIPDEMKNILSSLSDNNKNNNTDQESSRNNTNNARNETENPNIDIETIMKMKQIMDKMKGNSNDPRANLLTSLKPYLKESRKDKVDQYIKLFNMSKVMEIFNNTGGETKK